MNKVILIGNLTRDVELSTTPSGTSYAKFSLAVNRPFTNSEGEHDVDYINIVAWRDLAERCAQYLSKGKKVCAVGMLQTRSYEANDGSGKRYVTEVVASEVEFLTPKGESSPPAPPAPPAKRTPQKSGKSSFDGLQLVEDDGELPF